MNQDKNGVFYFKNLLKYPHLFHGISTKAFGSMKNKGKVDIGAIEYFVQKVFGPLPIALAEQVHGGDIAVVTDVPLQRVSSVDGLMTEQKAICLGIVTADCLPILFYDFRKGIVAAAHAGYKGIVQRIIRHVIQRFRELGSNPEDIVVGVGPGIGDCCYDVAPERIALFKTTFPTYHDFYKQRDGKYFLDLQQVVFLNLVEEGVKKEHIELAGICTKDTNDTFFSYRAEGAETFGEFVSIIGMRMSH